jgi:hypothetical protein
LALAVCALFATQTVAQSVDLSGLVYMDYAYTLASPDNDEEGENAFGIRRLYLTADYGISDDFSVRARLEANDGSTTQQDRLAPFVKDLYLQWKDAIAEGHDIQLGITSPPSYTVSERHWGYRSLEKTVLDRTSVVASRDMGVLFRGRLDSGGSVRYGVMLGNNTGGKAETDKNKRVYGQLEFYPNETVTVTIGGDYATYSDNRDNTVNGNAFVGLTRGRVKAGVEGAFGTTSIDGAPDNQDFAAISIFARGALSEKAELVGRFDHSRTEFAFGSVSEDFFVAGVALRPHPNVRIIPNILYTKNDNDADGFATGRLTLHADF